MDGCLLDLRLANTVAGEDTLFPGPTNQQATDGVRSEGRAEADRKRVEGWTLSVY